MTPDPEPDEGPGLTWRQLTPHQPLAVHPPILGGVAVNP